MKKLLFSAFLTLTFSLSFAQIGGFLEDTQWGAKAGLNYYRIHNFAGDDGKFGFNAGVFALIPISYDNQYYIQPELSFSQKGEQNKTNTYALNYIDLPILFKAYFSERDSDFFGIVGPEFSFLVNKSGFSKGKNLQTFDYGVVGGLGYSYKRKYEVTARVEYDFPDVIKNQELKNNNVGVSLNFSYIF